MGIQPKSLFGLRKRIAMGQRPTVSANANGPMPMMNKGGRTKMSKSGNAKHHDKKMVHKKATGGHMVGKTAPAFSKGGGVKKECHGGKMMSKGGHAKKHHGSHGHSHMKSSGVHKMHHGHKA